MDFSSIVSEDKIKRAIKDGEFEGLPGMGKPLKKDDAAHVPEHLRMAYPPPFRRFSSLCKPCGDALEHGRHRLFSKVSPFPEALRIRRP